MAQDIVSGLFGLNPNQVRQQQQQQLALQAQNYAQQDPFQRATAGMYQAGAGLAQAGAEGLFGMQNPEVIAAQQRQAMAQQMDLTTPQGTYAAAKMAQDRGDVEMAARLAAMARQMEEEQSVQQFRAAQTQQMLTPKPEKVDMTNIEKLYAARDRALAAGNQQMANSIDAVIRKETRIPVDGGAKQERISKKEIKADIEKANAAQSANIQFNAIERNIDQLYDKKSKKLKPAAEALFGQYAQYAPDVVLSQESVDAKNALESLTNQVMLSNLADAKERVGQSFGSMQAQEWDKFTQQLISLNRSQSPKSAADAMEYVRNFIKTKRKVFDVAMGDVEADKGGGLPEGSTPIGRTPQGQTVYQSPDGRKWVQ